MTEKDLFEEIQKIVGCNQQLMPDIELKALKGWDSLAVMQVIAFVDDREDRVLDIAAVARCKTLRELAELAGALN